VRPKLEEAAWCARTRGGVPIRPELGDDPDRWAPPVGGREGKKGRGRRRVGPGKRAGPVGFGSRGKKGKEKKKKGRWAYGRVLGLGKRKRKRKRKGGKGLGRLG